MNASDPPPLTASSITKPRPDTTAEPVNPSANSSATTILPDFDGFPGEKPSRKRDDWIAIANFHPG